MILNDIEENQQQQKIGNDIPTHTHTRSNKIQKSGMIESMHFGN